MSADTHNEDVCYFDNGRHTIDLENDLEGIATSTTEIINISTTYQPAWGPIEGFRENYQNWKDGIMRSFKILECDFQVVAEHSDHQKLFLVYHPDAAKSPKKLLGFIKFSYDNDNNGICELTNFKASLQREHLGLGGTSKADDIKQLGQHGEGLKLSALVNLRHPHNYSFVVVSSGFRWIFGWNVDKKLNCLIQRIPRAELVQQKTLAAQDDERHLARALKGRAWEDVSVIVGEPRHCRSFAGAVQESPKIPLAHFESWTSRILDICLPNQIVRTEYGDLILDPSHAGKIYLHGLQLPSGSKSNLPFVYAYNLLNIRTGRDRDTVTDAQAEAKKIASIWSSAIQAEKKSGQAVLIEKYIDLILEKLYTAADVHTIDRVMSRLDASIIWNELKNRARKNSQFYYCATSDSYARSAIINRLELTPLSLDQPLWSMLQRFDLCSTVWTEASKRFQRAKTVTIGTDSFSQHVMHAMRALVAQEPSLGGLEIVPVDSGNLGIKADYHRGKFKIDSKWFTYEGSHESSFCEHASEGAPELKRNFTCDHVVMSLWEHLLFSFRDRSYDSLYSSRQAFLTSVARAKLQQMPRTITLKTNEAKSELYVRWISMEPHKNADKLLVVTLHTPACELANSISSALLYRDPTVRDCTCQSIRARVGASGVTFTNISPAWTYYPKIARDEDSAVYGMTSGVTPNELPSLPAEPVASQGGETVADLSNIEKVCKLAEGKEWTSVSHDNLFKGGFPYNYNWKSAQQSGSQLLFATSKSTTFRENLKRVIDDDSADTDAKKVKSDPNSNV